MLPVAAPYTEYPVYDLYELHAYPVTLGVLRRIILII